MQEQQDGHGLSGIMVQAAQQPPTAHLMLDVIDAFPCGLRARAVRHPEKQASDKLHKKRKQQCASPDVTPTRSSWNVLVEGLVDEPLATRALVQPINNAVDHAMGSFVGRPA